MVLYQVSDDYIGVYQPSLCAHRILARPRAAFAAASRISPKLIFFPFLLASAPFSDRVPGCTRIVAWSPSTAYWSLSPGLICSAWRIFPGIVVCPFLVTVEWGMNRSLPLIYSLHLYYALPGHRLARARQLSARFFSPFGLPVPFHPFTLELFRSSRPSLAFLLPVACFIP